MLAAAEEEAAAVQQQHHCDQITTYFSDMARAAKADWRGDEA